MILETGEAEPDRAQAASDLVAPIETGSSARGRWTQVAPDVVFAVVVFHLAATRYDVLTDRRAPATVDAGNWLAFGHALLGRSSRSVSIVYPPVVPLLLVGLSRLVGVIAAVGLVGAASATLPAIAMYLVLRSAHLRWPAVALGSLLGASASVGEAAAWGGFPQLIGLATVVVFLASLDRYLRAPAWRPALVTVALWTLILATSHFVAIFAALAAAATVSLALLAVRRGRCGWLRDRVPKLLLMVLPVVAVIPIYAPLLGAIAANGNNDAANTTVGLSNVLDAVAFTFRDAPIVWRLLTLFAVSAPLATWERWRRPEWRLHVAGLLALVATVALTHQVRFMAFLPLVATSGAALWLLAGATIMPTSRRWVPGLVAAIAAVVLVVQARTASRLFVTQREFYGVVDPSTLSALEWTRSHTPTATTLAVPSVDKAPLGWWAEGYARRTTFYGSPLEWLSFPDERRRARIANSILSPTFPDETSLAMARKAGIDLILVPRRGVEYNPAAVRSFLQHHPDRVAFQNAGIVIIRTGSS